MGNVLERVADDVRVETDEDEYLVVRLSTSR